MGKPVQLTFVIQRVKKIAEETLGFRNIPGPGHHLQLFLPVHHVPVEEVGLRGGQFCPLSEPLGKEVETELAAGYGKLPRHGSGGIPHEPGHEPSVETGDIVRHVGFVGVGDLVRALPVKEYLDISARFPGKEEKWYRRAVPYWFVHEGHLSEKVFPHIVGANGYLVMNGSGVFRHGPLIA